MIAKDVTGRSSCTRTTQTVDSAGVLHRAMQPCQPGDIIQTFAVPLSSAQAQHLPYVVLPPENAPTETLLQTRGQIRQLVQNTRAAVTPKKHTTPQSSCAPYTQTAWMSYIPSSGNYLTMWTNFTEYSGCTFSVGQSEVQQSQYTQHYYWGDIEVDSPTGSRDELWPLYCRSIPVTSSPYTTYTPPSNGAYDGYSIGQEIVNTGPVWGDCPVWASALTITMATP